MTFERHIFSGLHMAVACEVDIAVACVLAHIYKKDGPMCSSSIMAEKLIFGMWQPYLFSDIIKYVYSDIGKRFGTHSCT